MSSFDIGKITENNTQSQRNHQEKVNAEFTSRFEEYWTQDKVTLKVDKDGDTVFFWIEENGQYYRPSQRSQGQRWYLSFYIKVVARAKEDRPNIILIDEPGLYLHAKAQKDLLRVLENHTSKFPIIFSTHSPYLIDEDNLESIRLVEKSNGMTTISNKVHATADKETLTPILTAIGLGINDSITNLDQKNNIVVEGQEDVFYLQAFKELTSDSIKFSANFVNGGGAGNMGIVGSILTGWGCNVCYLFDKDEGMKNGKACLINTWAVTHEKIREVIHEENCTVADILSKSDFQKYVLCDENCLFTSSNSTYLKENRADKVLLARQFLQRAKNDEVVLEPESFDRISRLFNNLIFGDNE